MLKKIIFPILFFFLISSNIKAQNFYKLSEFGASVGATQYFGDINDNYGFSHIRSNVGIFGRYNFNHYLALKLSANYTQVGYDDKDNKNAYQNLRNLSFRSNIFEAVLQAEFNFFYFETGNLEFQWTPYVTLGVGAFYYNPYAFYKGDKYYLRPLGTEGQNLGGQFADRKYGNFAMCLPIGVGIKWWLLPGVNMGIEIADRLTTTDYIDDVSQTYVGANNFSPDPSVINPSYYLQDPSLVSQPTAPLGRAGKQRGANATKDQYLMIQMHLSIQLKTYKCPANQSYWRSQF